MVLVLSVDVVVGCHPMVLKSLDLRQTKEALRVIPAIERGGCDNSMHGHHLGLFVRALIVVAPRGAKREDWVEIPREGPPKTAKTLDAIKE